MNKISIREFQLHASKYLKELPIVLTQYGKDIAFVTPIDAKVLTHPKSVNTLPPKVSTQSPNVVTKPTKSVNTSKKKGEKGMGDIPERKNKSILFE